jgi:hypothetical protein
MKILIAITPPFDGASGAPQVRYDGAFEDDSAFQQEKERMPVKPSDAEEEYFVRQETAKRKKLAEEKQAAMQQEERDRQRDLHYMKCPKCGMPLEEIAFGEVHVDKCFHCGGLWLDDGELERIQTIQTREPGFMGRLLGVFRP